MNSTFVKIYDIVSQIPVGKVATYGQIAVLAGLPRGARVVGWAMRAVPENWVLPCHRVVNKSGNMAPEYAFGGQEVQRSLLEAEGVTFNINGLINMEENLWKP
ncbi:MAG: cysteine methyltransferase [Clostridiales bacterium GWB2_37_7]|nr:MAG: cysteine methyltransferase [Clostridiales bacterium GWB2_37_7]